MNFLKRFFLLDLKDYENIGTRFPIGIFLIILTAALCAMIFVINYRKMYTTLLLKRLFRHGAKNEQGAKTLGELKLMDKGSIKRALSRSGQLTYVVKRVGAVTPSYEEYVAASKKHGFKEEKLDFTTARFYIPDEHSERAEKMIEKGSVSFSKPIILSAILIVILIVLCFTTPIILEFIDLWLTE